MFRVFFRYFFRYMVSGFLWLLAALPLCLVQVIGTLIGIVNFRLDTRSAKVTRENLKLCYSTLRADEVEDLTRKSLVQTGRTIMETPAIWLSPLSRSRQWILRVENEALLDTAIREGKGVVVLLPHLGNWEMFNVYFATRGKMTALYQPPQQVLLQGLIRDIRERVGNELVSTSIKGIARLYRCLEAGQVVTILPDQVPSTGTYATFFRQQALTDILASRLISRTGATAICCSVYRENSRFVVRFIEVDEGIYSPQIDQSLAALNSTVERAVSGCIDQYQWEYKRFRERPPGLKKLYKFGRKDDVYH
ncbi:MAG: lysophospholipid acyltransferase family protein [Pseudomonadales bacterium]|nr:lysophospholipid acyltransferase family protein [Pseudomonadales bacterium]